MFCPGSPPLLCPGTVVPVISRDGDFLPKVLGTFPFPDSCFLVPVFIEYRDAVLCCLFFIMRIICRQHRIINCSPLFILCIGKHGFLLFLPGMILAKPPHCQKDMGMRIAVLFVMQCPVSNHPFADKIFLNIISDTLDLLLPVHLRRQSHFDFPGQLCVGSFFYFLNLIPEGLPIPVLLRRILRKQDLTHHHTAFFRKVMGQTGLLVCQLLPCTVCCGCHCRPSAGSADDFNGAMINCHFIPPIDNRSAHGGIPKGRALWCRPHRTRRRNEPGSLRLTGWRRAPNLTCGLCQHISAPLSP